MVRHGPRPIAQQRAESAKPLSSGLPLQCKGERSVVTHFADSDSKAGASRAITAARRESSRPLSPLQTYWGADARLVNAAMRKIGKVE